MWNPLRLHEKFAWNFQAFDACDIYGRYMYFYVQKWYKRKTEEELFMI